MKIVVQGLEDDYVRLEPLSERLREPLRAALNCDPEAWALMVGSACGERFDAFFDAALGDMAKGTKVAWAVHRSSEDVIVGTTSLYEIKPEHRRCEIGATFYRPEARGGAVNPACKRLLLGHAFAAGAVRVEILTDAINPHSQAAIRKLGARDEGVLRKHKITWTGRVRDTALFAVLDEDWPEVRDLLDRRLAAFG
ncbi:GNAT family protein [Brevundimonas sp.]|uniref:GNAT family N-acetyltransferase n=1 Tax=Brevundimonas sp. TaxID=1871086 RepID=UPI001A298A5B|nr:GNAT family protein [Brevundimonas sp.]MBJ7484807.1 GNAT family N-acetyltransferase [Brevundimonas sp.]